MSNTKSRRMAEREQLAREIFVSRGRERPGYKKTALAKECFDLADAFFQVLDDRRSLPGDTAISTADSPGTDVDKPEMNRNDTGAKEEQAAA